MKVSLKALRVNAKMSQKQSAESLNVTKKTVQNWESGATSPDASKLLDICTVYHCTLNDIILPEKLAKSE